IDLVSSASQGNRRYSRLPAARRSKRTVSAYPKCIQVSTWLLCKVTSGYGAGTKKNVYKSVLGYGAGYGAGLRRMYTSQYVVTVPGIRRMYTGQYVVTVPVTVPGLNRMYKSVRVYGAGYGVGTRRMYT